MYVESIELQPIFGITSLAVIIFFLIKFRKDTVRAFQLIGTLLIMSLAIKSHNLWITFLSIFVIATLVTDLEFLTQLAALFLGRKEYWDFAVKKATQQEIRDKISEEIVIQDSGRGQRRNGFEDFVKTKLEAVKKAISLRDKILNLLGSEDGLFPKHHITKTDVVLESRDGMRIVVDAIAEGPGNYNYLIEIKLSNNVNVLFKAVEQLMNAIYIHNQLLMKIRNRYRTRGFIIALYQEGLPDLVNDIPILKYNSDTNKFVNLEPLHKWIYEL